MALPIRQNLKQSVRTFSVEVHLDLTAKIPGANEAKFKEAAENAKAGCPISKLYKGADITLDAKLA